MHDDEKITTINVNLNVNIPGVLGKLDRIEHLLRAQIAQGEIVAQELEELTAEVERNTSVDASVKELLVGLAAQIEAAGLDKAKLAALTLKLRGDNDSLAEAVLANTPSAPTP